MAAVPPAVAANPNGVGQVLQEIGLSPPNRAYLLRAYDDDPVTFAFQWSFGLGYEALKNMDGQVFQEGGNDHTFTTVPTQRDAIQGFALWLHTTIAQGITPDIPNRYLGPDVNASAATQRAWIRRAREIYQLMRRKTDSHSRVEDNLVDIEKGALRNVAQWEKVKELIDHGLRHMTSANEVGNLRYLTREDMTNLLPNAAVDIYDPEYQGDFDKMQYGTLSIHYPSAGVTILETVPNWRDQRDRVREDSGRLWELISKVTEGQPTYDLVRKFRAARDGIGAYRRLREEAEGSTASTTKKATAYKTIQTTMFTGRSPRFNFTAFVTKQEGAFAVLAEEGEPQAESKKVNDLLTHITDPRLENAKDNIVGDDAKLNNYHLATQYLGTCLANRLSSASPGSDRKVAMTESEKKEEEEREAKATEQKTPSGVKWQDGRWLPKSEYAKLHAWERAEHKKVVANLPAHLKKGNGRKRTKKRKGSPNDDTKDDKSSRKAGAVSTEKTGTQSDAKAGTDGTTEVPSTAPAGDQFGRASHSKKKKGVSFDEMAKKTETLSITP